MIPKFRAYSTEENEMYYPHNDKNVDWTIDDETGFIAPLVNLGSGMWGMIDKYELMQSTGLKDKNSVEIYEGDVCKIQRIPSGMKPIFVVSDYIKEKLIFSKITIFDQNSYEEQGGYTGNFLEVIGNRFENQELLEEAIE